MNHQPNIPTGTWAHQSMTVSVNEGLFLSRNSVSLRQNVAKNNPWHHTLPYYFILFFNQFLNFLSTILCSCLVPLPSVSVHEIIFAHQTRDGLWLKEGLPLTFERFRFPTSQAKHELYSFSKSFCLSMPSLPKFYFPCQ